ncbi:cupin domain-containing protein [Akkermansia muciniphila]|nr:cupin domain-containing protein [Akkermansia muciniphila]
MGRLCSGTFSGSENSGQGIRRSCPAYRRGDFSFQLFQPGTETGFLHTHKNHEELYFFLSGRGEFQVDGTVFPVAEGSVVRVAPPGKRSVRNNGSEPLVMLCVQYRGNTFTSEDALDGDILDEPVKWQ